MRSFADIRADFPAVSRVTYLNTGSVGIVPTPVLDALAAWLSDYYGRGPMDPEVLKDLNERVRQVRAQVAAVIGAGPDDVAWVDNVTTGIDTVALGLPWQRGDQIIVAGSDHIAGLMPWRRLEQVAGVEVVTVPVGPETGWQVDPDRVEAAITPRTRLICLSHVSFSTGGRLDAAAIGEIARRRGVLYLLDGAQSAGAVPVNVRATRCHFYSYPGYKWTLAPEGTSALYVDPEALERVEVHRVGYFGATKIEATGRYDLQPNALRFQGTTYGVDNYVAWGMSLRYLQDLGVERVYRRIAELATLLRRRLAELPGVRVITPPDPATGGAPSGLTSFTIEGVEPSSVVEPIYRRFGVIIRFVRIIDQPNALRAATHIYNDESDVDRLVEAVAAIAAGK